MNKFGNMVLLSTVVVLLRSQSQHFFLSYKKVHQFKCAEQRVQYNSDIYRQFLNYGCSIWSCHPLAPSVWRYILHF